MPTLVTALLLGLVAGINGVLQVVWDGLERPIFMGAVVGLIMGDVRSGLVIGATIELAYLGLFAIGGAQPPDVITAGILGTAFAISAGQGPGEALAVALPTSLLGQMLWIGLLSLYSGLMHRGDRYAAEANVKGIVRLHWLGGLGMFLLYFVIVFLGFLLGKDAIQSFFNVIPAWFKTGLTVATGIFPALGFALLLNMLWRKSLVPYLVIGFALVVYFKLGLLAVAILGVALAVLHVQFTRAGRGTRSPEVG
jgi:mannose/fructose/N-acetylgalactosamine-specific phosphotransferase system component IIC